MMLQLNCVVLLLIPSLQALPQTSSTTPKCKVAPDSPQWPSWSQWQALNTSVSGRLAAVVPPGAVCHPTRPEFNVQTCQTISQQWTTEVFHANNPFSVNYNDDTCPPSAAQPCSNDGYPAYVISALNANDVQQGVKFAAKTGVRLVVKGTGHDVPGRSSGRGSLSIWTHNIGGITFNLNAGDSSVGSVGTAKIGAGVRNIEIYNAAAAKSVTIITGSDPGVGIGGLFTGAGHGPITSRYGLAADQVLSMQVVTADGILVTADPNTNADLFWAMRGGGGSTFGVIITATVRVYPNVPFTSYLFAFNTTADSDTFWSMLALFHTYLPSISEAGGMGYYFATPLVAGAPPTIAGNLRGILLFPFLNPTQAKKITAPLEAAIKSTNSGLIDQVFTYTSATQVASFSAAWPTIATAESVGIDLRLGSRLFDKAALTTNVAQLNSSLRTSTPVPNTLLGHLVAGPGPRNVKIPGGSNAVLPAWRSSYVHIVLYRTWVQNDPVSAKVIQDDLRNTRVPALVAQAPNTGAYVNEADPTTQGDWQGTFWGANYPRLKQLKAKWDPQGVFFCRLCVGFEDWTVSGGDVVGQDPGSICRAT